MPATHSIGGSGMDAPAGRGFHTKLPTTKLGRWSMWLAVAFVAGFIVNIAVTSFVGTNMDPGVREFSETYLPYWGITLFAVGFAAGVVGLIAIVKAKERSLITLLTLVPALFVVMFLLGEFLFPH